MSGLRTLITAVVFIFGCVLLIAACAGPSDNVPLAEAAEPAPTGATAVPTSLPTAEQTLTPDPADPTDTPSATAVPDASTATLEGSSATHEVVDVDHADLSTADFDRTDNAFSEYIQPIMERSCASCHGPELAGSDHFVIRNAGDIADSASGIEHLVSQRAMPPWPASPLSPVFADNPSLSDEEVARLVAWVEDGAPLDVDRSAPVVNSKPESRLVGDDRDIVMTPADGPYAGDPQNVDEYRCLVYEPGNDDLEHIIATHFEPDETQVVHHAVVTLASAALRDQAARLDAGDPGPGWSCFGGFGFDRIAGTNTTRLAGWAPGTQPARLPDGFAIPLAPGDFIVVQVHYHYDGSAPADASRYILSLASQEQIDANDGVFKQLTNVRYLGPAEIPCYAGDAEPLCDRDLAVQRTRELYGNRVAGFADFFLDQCGAEVSDFADMTDGTAWSTCDLRVRNPGRIDSVYGHMHELGQSIRLTLNPDTPEERVLLDIPDWDFEWQFGYAPVEEIIIDGDDIIRVDCAWNRERGPRPAVGYILWSDGTGDEMCFSSVTTMAVDS